MKRVGSGSLDYYRELANKLFDGTISEDEREELEVWYRNNEEKLVYIPRIFVEDQLDHEDRLIHKIREQIGLKERQAGKVKRLWIKGGWAAAILCVVFASIYFVLSNKKDIEQNSLLAEKAEALRPGGNKAILTLADGEKIVLDNLGNGEISRQKNISVVKLDNGEIACKKDGQEVVATAYNTITIPRGGQYQLTLEDGTKVWLNAESSLRFPTVFSEKNRIVELTGEGYFEVARQVEHPFFVVVKGVQIKVLGTHFVVSAYSKNGEVRTTLTEGSVQILSGRSIAKLSPGQQAKTRAWDNDIRITKSIDTTQVLAWKEGYFRFDEASLQTILSEVARWYDASIVYEGDVNDKFTGTLPRSESITKLLKVLEATEKVKFQIEGKKIIVNPNK